MPKRSTEELILAREQELAELRARAGQSKVTEVTKLNKEIKALDERIDKLVQSKQAKVDKRDLIQREIDEAKAQSGQADGSDKTQASTDVTVGVGA